MRNIYRIFRIPVTVGVLLLVGISCAVDYRSSYTQVIQNDTKSEVEFKVYSRGNLDTYFELKPSEAQIKQYSYTDANYFTLFDLYPVTADSIAIIFDRTKLMMFYHNDSLSLNPAYEDSYVWEKDPEYEYTYLLTYSITDQVYDMATPYICNCK